MENNIGEHAPSDGNLELDPFGFIPEALSRIPGMGGPMPPIDPSYAFHTPYVAIARGTVNFDVRFENLKARRGTLTLRVHMLPDEPGAIARLVNSERIQLNRLAAQHGHISISTEGFRGVTYALVGAIPDDTDISADALHIRIDRRDGQHDDAASISDARNTVFGNDLLKPSPHILSMDEPRFDQPVSQAFTPPQLPDAVSRLRLNGSSRSDIRQWECAYVVNVLDYYGMLADGAKGLCVIEGETPIPALLAAAGPTLDVVALRSDTIDDPAPLSDKLFAHPGVPSRADVADRATVTVSETLDLEKGIANLDFLYTDHICDRLDIVNLVSFLDDVTGRLRPGGLGVHLIAADMSQPERERTSGERMIYGRRGFEQMALTLISRNYEVARLRFGHSHARLSQHVSGDAAASGSFALVIRRPRSAL